MTAQLPWMAMPWALPLSATVSGSQSPKRGTTGCCAVAMRGISARSKAMALWTVFMVGGKQRGVETQRHFNPTYYKFD